MNKKIKVMISILILVVILAMQISYAVSNKETAKTSFMKLSKDEISIGETLEITFDLSSIKAYDNFTIKLSSNVTLNNAYFDEKSNLKLLANKDDVSIEINKSELNLDKITLYYDVPKTVSVGDIIEFTVNVTTVQNNQEEEKKEKDSKTTENTSAEIKVLDETKKVTIIESAEEKSTEIDEKEKSNEKTKNTEEKDSKDSSDSKDLKETTENENSKQSKNNDTDEKTTNSQKPSEDKSSSKETSSTKTSTSGAKSSSGSGSSSSSQTATYKGSNNNYLSNIELEGATLNTSFNKENTTYFATVKNVSTLNIVATAEDSTASVNYTGNDSIQIGENKILISVTAQNGSVRYYRIFVTCEEE